MPYLFSLLMKFSKILRMNLKSADYLLLKAQKSHALKNWYICRLFHHHEQKSCTDYTGRMGDCG